MCCPNLEYRVSGTLLVEAYRGQNANNGGVGREVKEEVLGMESLGFNRHINYGDIPFRVALVNPQTEVEEMRPVYGWHENLGNALIARTLRADGSFVRLFDLRVDRMNEREFVAVLVTGGYSVIGLSVNYAILQSALLIAQLVAGYSHCGERCRRGGRTSTVALRNEQYSSSLRCHFFTRSRASPRWLEDFCRALEERSVVVPFDIFIQADSFGIEREEDNLCEWEFTPKIPRGKPVNSIELPRMEGIKNEYNKYAAF